MSRISDITSRLQQKTDTQKSVSGSLNPTLFEKDIVSALNGQNDVREYQSAYAMSVARLCARNIVSFVGGVKSAKKSPESASGETVLSPLYRRYMCGGKGRCSGESKSDIIINSQMNGKMLVSVKKEGSAQLTAAGAGEASAVISAALGEDRNGVKAIRSILTAALSKENYYTAREEYARKNNTKPEAFDAMLGAITGMKTKAGAMTRAEIEAFNKFLETLGIKSQITLAMQEYLASPRAREAVLKEFASGSKRFIKSESDRSAEWFLLWSDKGYVKLADIDEFVGARLGSFRMNIRDRGDRAGGSLRVDFREAFDLDSIEYQEYLLIERRMHQDFDYDCLTEGVLDTTLSLVRTAGAAVAEAYKRFIGAVKTAMSMIARLLAKGIAALLDFFGIEVEELSYTW